MKKSRLSLFVLIAASLLTLTGLAKILSICSNAKILDIDDPVFGMRFRHLLLLAGLVEIAIACICFLYKQHVFKLMCIAWIATSFFGYRLVLWLTGWHRPCYCMGSFTEALHFSHRTADTCLKIVLAYLLIGSYGGLFWLWRQKHKTHPVAPSLENSDSSAA